MKKKDPFNIKFIGEIKKHECLWNPQCKQFFHKSNMYKAWADISTEMGEEEEKLRARWKNLKDTYRRELKKRSDTEYQCEYIYFKDLDFLRPTMDVPSETQDIQEVNIEEKSLQSLLSDEDSFYWYVDEEETKEDPCPSNKKRKVDYEVELTPTDVIDSKLDEEKYDEQFLVSLLPFLKKLDPVRKLLIRSKIQEAVVSELLRNKHDK